MLVLGRGLIKGVPGPQVAPSEIYGLDEDIVGLLHDGVVDGDGGGAGESLVDKTLLAGSGVSGVGGVEYVADFGAIFAEGVQDGLRRPDEDAGVPEKLAAVEKHLGHLQVGFLREGLHLSNARPSFHAGTLLDIAVAGVGVGGLNAECQQSGAVFHEVESFRDGLPESILFEHEMVGGKGDDRGLGVEGEDMVGGPADAGGRVAAGGLEKDVALLYARELLDDDVAILAIGHQDYVFYAYDRKDALHGQLQEAFACPEEVKKLFRLVVAAEWPKREPTPPHMTTQ